MTIDWDKMERPRGSIYRTHRCPVPQRAMILDQWVVEGAYFQCECGQWWLKSALRTPWSKVDAPAIDPTRVLDLTPADEWEDEDTGEASEDSADL